MKNAIGLTLHPDQIAFLEEASQKLDQSRSTFARDALMAHAARALGRDAPEVPEPRRGRMSEIKKAADAEGLTTQEFMRRAALRELGINVPSLESPARGGVVPQKARRSKKRGKR